MFSLIRKTAILLKTSLIGIVLTIQPLLFHCAPHAGDDYSSALAVALVSQNSSYSTSFSLEGPDNGGNADLTVAPYFESGLFTVTSLQDDSKFPLKIVLSNVAIQDKNGTVIETANSFKGVLLRDVINRGAKFKPFDKGKDGRATVIVLEGNDGYKAIVSYTELMRTEVGANMIVAYEKNGALLDASSGSMAVVSKSDTNRGMRYVKFLKRIRVINDWLTQSGTGTTSSFSVTGDVSVPKNFTLADLQNPALFTNRDFSAIGPISNSKHYILGKGVLLSEVIAKAGLAHPDQPQKYYVILEATDKYRITHSYAELINTKIGPGIGSLTSPGVVVISEFKKGLGGNYYNPPASTGDYTSCTGTGNVCDGDYTATISSEDTAAYGGDVSAGINLGPRKMSWLNSIVLKYVE
ncbi:molybdopterin-dependent oxidoreductase [Leptospira barantonii]|uniref:Oxidoreductase molybdopterin-binding domain-containing protein n=1 Tax=Leptospira barantonii TaxID=2023184 RepID=A0ABX4NSL3_9LEPT|nr:molybdopterin-dependent oxidoreductase [Leptospira barantonii]PJZ58866.1 hypothetical protein CH367_02155 [Leptospira barantonii]